MSMQDWKEEESVLECTAYNIVNIG
jgi:hypothetical protein